MPCVFGASPGERAGFLQLEAHYRAVFGTVDVAVVDGISLGGHAHGDAPAVQSTASAALAAIGERPLYQELARADALTRLAPGGRLSALVRGNLAIAASQQLVVGCDWLSCFPMYFAATRDGVLFSSHLAPLAAALTAAPDPAGVVQFLTVGFCLNGRTPIGGIQRLLPGQRLSWAATTGSHHVTDDSQLWAGEATAPVNVERTWQLLCDTLPADEAVPGIMLSAGWDSRLLLAAAVARRRSQRLLTVSHGQPDQFELIMARRLARCAEATHHEVSLGRDALGSASELDVLFARSEALLFPYWRLSADRLRQQGAAFSTCGVLGEVLGGHYASRGSRVKRLLHLFKLRAGNESAANGVSIRALMPKPPRRPLWYLDREYLEDHRVRVGEAYEADIAETLSRYQRRGIPPGDRMVEAFITEHRAIQMVAHQPLAAFAYLDVILPFADRTLTQELTRIPVRDRIQNALSRRILSRYAPEYLRVPLAATGFAASAPIPVEVVGRAGRYAIEAVSSAAVLASGGRFGRRRPFGWMNFDQVLRPTDPIRAIVDSLRTPLINKEAVMSHLDDIDAYRAPIKLAHVFLKLVQLDRLVARSQSR